MAFDGIDISIGGDSSTAKAAIASVRSSLSGLERSANSASDSVEELGDNVSGTGAKLTGLAATAGVSATALTGVSLAGTGASASMAALSSSLAAVTVGLSTIATLAAPLVATLGTVAAAAGGLATSFGAVVGSGLLAFGRQQAAVMEDAETATEALAQVVNGLKAEIRPLVTELGEAFVPLIESAVEEIPTLAENVIAALGPLDEFASLLSDLGDAAMVAIPEAVEALVDLGRRALPFMRELIAVVGGNLESVFNGMTRATEQVGNELLQIASAAAGLIPELTKTGSIIIEAVTPAIVALIDTARNLFQQFNAFVRSEAGAEMFAEIRREITPLIPRVRQLLLEFRPVFDALITNLPEIISGFAALANQALDIAEALSAVLVPALRLTIDVVGSLASIYASFVNATEESKQDVVEVIEAILSAFKALKNWFNNVFSLSGFRDEIEETREAIGGLIDELQNLDQAGAERFGSSTDLSPDVLDGDGSSGGGGDSGGGTGPGGPATGRSPGHTSPGGALATGGIVTEPMNALIAEGSEHEAVMPLSRLEEFVNRGSGMTIEELNVHASDRREGREAAQAIKQELKSQF